MLITTGVLPDMFQSLAFVMPQGDGPEKYDLEIVQITDIAPQAEIQECKDNIQMGLLREANRAVYVLSRRMYSLGLLVKLFDTYQ
jgi:predicted transcriptional regulator